MSVQQFDAISPRRFYSKPLIPVTEQPPVIDVEEQLKQKFCRQFNIRIRTPFKINRIEQLDPFLGMQFEKYNVDVELNGLVFNLAMIISPMERRNCIRKLTVTAYNDTYKEEFQSCINHLQRRRNLEYALERLSIYSQLFEQRKQVLTYLQNTLKDRLTAIYTEEDGYDIVCRDPNVCDLYFMAKWKIWWNCRNFVFFDYIKFVLNKEYPAFYNKTRGIMQDILKPSLDLTEKLHNWVQIAESVNEHFVTIIIDPDDNNNASSSRQLRRSVSANVRLVDLDYTRDIYEPIYPVEDSDAEPDEVRTNTEADSVILVS